MVRDFQADTKGYSWVGTAHDYDIQEASGAAGTWTELALSSNLNGRTSILISNSGSSTCYIGKVDATELVGIPVEAGEKVGIDLSSEGTALYVFASGAAYFTSYMELI